MLIVAPVHPAGQVPAVRPGPRAHRAARALHSPRAARALHSLDSLRAARSAHRAASGRGGGQ
jgi:hypothetical protein